MKTLLISLFSFLIMVSFIKAEECIYSYETKPEEGKYTKQYSIDTDRAEHSVRIFSIENNYKDKNKNCEGLSIVKEFAWGYSDYINKSGPVKGYGTQIYSDGSTILLRFEGTSQNPEGKSENFINIGTQYIVGGTGLYKNVKGYGKTKGEFNPDTGYYNFKNILKYTK